MPELKDKLVNLEDLKAAQTVILEQAKREAEIQEVGLTIVDGKLCVVYTTDL